MACELQQRVDKAALRGNKVRSESKTTQKENYLTIMK